MSGPLDFDVDDAPAGGPEPQPPPGDDEGRARPPAGAPSRYVWVVGAAALVLIAVLVIATLHQGTGRGARGVPAGDVMPPFAVPKALSDLEGDANIADKAGEGAAGAVPACSVRGPRVLNGCALRERGPVILAFFATRGRDCIAQLDVLQHALPRLPGVQVAAVAVRGDRAALRSLIRAHRWTFPIGYDRDGALAEAYHVQVCPQMTFARAGGRVTETTFGLVDAPALAGKAARLR
jgi:hypothetical protein